MSRTTDILCDKTAMLAYPQNASSQHYRDFPAPDTVFIAHQALHALGANVKISDTIEGQKLLLSNENIEFVLEISGFGNNPSMESLLGLISDANNIGFFPSNGITQIIASDKLVSKRFALSAGLRVPRTITNKSEAVGMNRLVRKPICGGESQGLELVDPSIFESKGFPTDDFCEQYIEGVDATFLVLVDPKTKQPHVIAAFENQDLTKSKLTTNETKKKDHAIYGRSVRSRTSILGGCDKALIDSIEGFTRDICFPPISRLDFRKTQEKDQPFVFLEVNTDPTLGANQLWYTPIKEWCATTEYKYAFDEIDALPIHPSAKVMAFVIWLNQV